MVRPFLRTSVSRFTVRDNLAGSRRPARDSAGCPRGDIGSAPAAVGGTKIKIEEDLYLILQPAQVYEEPAGRTVPPRDVINRLGLAHPEVAFTLISDGRELTRTKGSGNLHDQAIAGIYGLATTRNDWKSLAGFGFWSNWLCQPA